MPKLSLYAVSGLAVVMASHTSSYSSPWWMTPGRSGYDAWWDYLQLHVTKDYRTPAIQARRKALAKRHAPKTLSMSKGKKPYYKKK